MYSSGVESNQPASKQFKIEILGGDAIFLVDRQAGHKIYMGTPKRLNPVELRNYLASIRNDIEILSIEEFSNKYNLH